MPAHDLADTLHCAPMTIADILHALDRRLPERHAGDIGLSGRPLMPRWP